MRHLGGKGSRSAGRVYTRSACRRRADRAPLGLGRGLVKRHGGPVPQAGALRTPTAPKSSGLAPADPMAVESPKVVQILGRRAS